MRKLAGHRQRIYLVDGCVGKAHAQHANEMRIDLDYIEILRVYADVDNGPSDGSGSGTELEHPGSR